MSEISARFKKESFARKDYCDRQHLKLNKKTF